MALKNVKECSFEIVLVLLIAVIPASLCYYYCDYGYLYSFYGSVTVDVGSNATFICHGDGSYLYWFINGINTENMTSEEIEDRGMSFSGYYNNYPPYYYYCDIQYSHMTIAGNCLNNNSEIYCVILGTYPPPDGGNTTSSVANLTVNGDSPVVNNVEVFSVDTNSLFISWDVYTSTNNCTFTLNIIDSYNSMDTIHLPCCDRAYEYTINNPDPCSHYNITLTVETDVLTCTDSRSVLISETPAKAKNVTAEIESNSILIVQFEVYSTLCDDIPNKLEVFLVDDNGRDTQSSGLILWEDIDDINGIYQFEWHVLLNNNTFYQIFIISHSILGQAISEPFILSTYDTQKLDHTLNGSELCLTCTFTLHSIVKGCTVSILLSSTLYHLILEIPRVHNSATGCLTLSENGTYQVSVYDWENTGIISIKPAVVENIVINEVPSISNIIKNVSPSKSVFSTQSLESDLTSTALPTSKNQHPFQQNITNSVIDSTVRNSLHTPTSRKDDSNQSTLIIFITLFGITVLTLAVVFIAGTILIIRKKLQHKKKNTIPVLNPYIYKIDNSDCVSAVTAPKLPTSQLNQESPHTYEIVNIPSPYVNVNVDH